MSKLSKGEVSITLAGNEYTLKPSLTCYNRLATGYDNYGVLLGMIANGNVPAIATVIRFGLGFSDAQAKKIPEMLMATGLGHDEVRNPLSEFVFRLFNGGKSVEEVMKSQEAEPKKDEEEGETDPFAA